MQTRLPGTNQSVRYIIFYFTIKYKKIADFMSHSWFRSSIAAFAPTWKQTKNKWGQMVNVLGWVGGMGLESRDGRDGGGDGFTEPL